VEKRQQQFKFDLGLQVRETVFDVAQHVRRELGAYRTADPCVAGRAQLVVQP